MGLQVHSLETLDGAKKNKRGWVLAKYTRYDRRKLWGEWCIVCAFNSMGEEYSECIVIKETGNGDIQSNQLATSDRLVVEWR